MKALKTFSIIPYKDRLIKLSDLSNGKIIYQDFYIDLISNEKVEMHWSQWFLSQNFSIGTYFNKPKMVHLFYELGFFLNGIDADLKLSKTTILAIELDYNTIEDFIIESNASIALSEQKIPDLKTYTEKFNLGYEELIQGNCYQFNLTEEFIYQFENGYTPFDFIQRIWKSKQNRGAYGSATYLPFLNKLFLSNSPECLFEIEERIIRSRPIKGTMVREISQDNDLKKLFQKLKNDLKNQSELFMIIDLIRNDLSSIELPKAVVKKKQAPLLVPGLIHQYAEIEIEVSEKLKMNKIIEKLFPGGSITGAPKKRVMKILNHLEKRERNFYCGSTIIYFKELKSASINIRSSEIDFDTRELRYQAGGGITLQSTSDSEFQEMSYKEKSFIKLLTP